MKSVALTILAVALLHASSGCGPFRSAPCPSDLKLIDFHTAHQAEFVKLETDPDNAELLRSLGIERVIKRQAAQKKIWFEVWFHDFPGPGGCMKGYAYCEDVPATLVTSIDDNSDPGSPEIKEIYRKITENWYLFYQSDN